MIKIRTLFTCFFLTVTFSLCAQTISKTDVDKVVYEEMVRQELPGLAIGVYQVGKINYTKGYGYQDLNRTKPVNDRTIFSWASISKPLTAVAAFQLIEGKNDFDIDDLVIDHYPYWSPHKIGTSNFRTNKSKLATDDDLKKVITLKHLLSHYSGIDHYANGVWGNRTNYRSDTDKFNREAAVDAFKKNKLISKPGSEYKYSTQGYVLLGAVIDKFTGSYPNYIKRNIADKLAMTSIRTPKGKTWGFQKKEDGIVKPKDYPNTEWVLPSGGWESDIRDLLKFGKGIVDEKLLKDTNELWYSNSFQKYYGLKSSGRNDDLRVFHGGAHANLRTFLWMMPKRKIVIALMVPSQYADCNNFVRKITMKMGIDLFKNEIVTTPKFKCNKDMSSSTRRFNGVWRKTNGKVILRRGYSTNSFNKEWNFLKKRGYQVFDIEAYNQNGKLMWDGIFKKTVQTGFSMWRNFSQADFDKKWREMGQKGYRLYDVESYVVSGKRKWAGLFKKGTGKHALFSNYSTSNFGKKRDDLAKQGYKLIDIEVFDSKDGLKWTGVWTEGKEGLLNRNYDTSKFKDLVEQRNMNGYKLLDMETYKVNGKTKWAGIWEKSPEYQRANFWLKYCDIMESYQKNSEEYELIDLESF